MLKKLRRPLCIVAALLIIISAAPVALADDDASAPVQDTNTVMQFDTESEKTESNTASTTKAAINPLINIFGQNTSEGGPGEGSESESGDDNNIGTDNSNENSQVDTPAPTSAVVSTEDDFKKYIYTGSVNTITLENDITLTKGYDIFRPGDNPFTLNLDGHTLTIDSTESDCGLHIGASATVTINGLDAAGKQGTITSGSTNADKFSAIDSHGTLAISGVNFTNISGHAVRTLTDSPYTDGKSLSINNCKFTNISATSDGGAICIQKDTGTVSISNCTFENNETDGNGGAIYAHFTKQGTINISDCAMTNNTAGNIGGALWCDDETRNICDNTSKTYTGITLTINNTVITDNHASTDYGGGGVAITNVAMTTDKSTKIYGNTRSENRVDDVYSCTDTNITDILEGQKYSSLSTWQDTSQDVFTVTENGIDYQYQYYNETDKINNTNYSNTIYTNDFKNGGFRHINALYPTYSFTVTYDDSDTTNEPEVETIYKYAMGLDENGNPSTTATFTATTPNVREGYVFMGWAEKDGDGTIIYQPGDTITLESKQNRNTTISIEYDDNVTKTVEQLAKIEPITLNLEAVWAKAATIKPASMYAYVGGDSLNGNAIPVLRFAVDGLDASKLANAEITLHNGDDEKNVTAYQAGDYLLIPQLDEDFDTSDTTKVSGTYLSLTDADKTSQTHAGTYKLQKNGGWYLTATIDDEQYVIDIDVSGFTLTTLTVTDESKMYEDAAAYLNPVVSSLNGTAEKITAVIPDPAAEGANATSPLTGRDTATSEVNSPLGLIGFTESKELDTGSHAIALLVDDLLGEERGLAADQLIAKLGDDYQGDEWTAEVKYLDLVNANDGNLVLTNTSTTIVWPYPEGLSRADFEGDDAAYELVVAHYKNLDRTMAQTLDDTEVEYLTPKFTDQGIEFQTESFSPFAVLYKSVDTENPADDITDPKNETETPDDKKTEDPANNPTDGADPKDDAENPAGDTTDPKDVTEDPNDKKTEDPTDVKTDDPTCKDAEKIDASTTDSGAPGTTVPATDKDALTVRAASAKATSKTPKTGDPTDVVAILAVLLGGVGTLGASRKIRKK